MAFSQIVILDPIHPGGDLNGATLDALGSPSDSDIGVSVFVYNSGTTDVELKVRRTEVDVTSGTRNVTCWVVCPLVVNEGDEVVQLSNLSAVVPAGDTNETFYAHCYPDNMDGCSLFKYEWVDANDPSVVYAYVNVVYSHTTTSCAANLSVEESSSIVTSIYPNPSDGRTFLNIEGVVGEISYEVSNLLGQRSLIGKSHIENEGVLNFDAAALKDGVYFVTIKNNGKVLKTEKLVVKH